MTWLGTRRNGQVIYLVSYANRIPLLFKEAISWWLVPRLIRITRDYGPD